MQLTCVVIVPCLLYLEGQQMRSLSVLSLRPQAMSMILCTCLQEELWALSSPEQASAGLVAAPADSTEQATTPSGAAAVALSQQQTSPAAGFSPQKPAAQHSKRLGSDAGKAPKPSLSSGATAMAAKQLPALAAVPAGKPSAEEATSDAEVAAQPQQSGPAPIVRSPLTARSSAQPATTSAAAEPAPGSALASPAKSGQQPSRRQPAAESPAASPAAPSHPSQGRRSGSIPLSPFALESGSKAGPAGPEGPADSLKAGSVAASLSPGREQGAGQSKAELVASIAAVDATISRLQAAVAEQRPLVEAAAARAQAAQARMDELQVPARTP